MDYGVRSAPACVLRFGVGGEVAAMWRFGTDADVAVRDQAVRAGGGSRGELMVPLYSARWALVSPFSVRAGGVGATSREANRSFHTLVMREGSLEVKCGRVRVLEGFLSGSMNCFLLG